MQSHFFLFFLVFFSACHSSVEQHQYLFLGHTYQWGVVDNNRIDDRFKDFDFSPYEQIWLGGDLCARTNESPATLAYLDSMFDLSSETTHWTWGNHDIKYGTWQSIMDVTQRKSYYTTSFNGINLMIWNTLEFHYPQYTPKPQECILLEEQLEMIEQMADTVQSASHLVILHHYALLKNEMTGNTLKMNELWNLYIPELTVDCAGKESFESRIYPLLVKIQEKGTQVILIGGDLGQRTKSFEYKTDEGIWFLGSGINNSAIDHYLPDYVTDTSPDKILLFDHDVKNRKLTWRFEEFNKLVDPKQKPR